jgi:hypothetical protein
MLAASFRVLVCTWGAARAPAHAGRGATSADNGRSTMAVYVAYALGEGPHGANLVIARIVYCHIDDGVLDGSGGVNAGALDTIGRMGGDGYVRTTDRFSLPRAKSRAG